MIKDPVHWPEGGRITLTWYLLADHGRMGIFRFHKTPDEIPGDYDAVVTVLVEDGEYEMLGFLALNNPTKAEYKKVYGLLAALGLKRKRHDRAKHAKRSKEPCYSD